MNNVYLKEKRWNHLVFRPLQKTDIKVWSDFFKDEASTRFFPPSNDAPLERAERWITKQLNRYAEGSYGLMAICNEKDEMLGQCGILIQKVEDVDLIEVGYHLLPAHRNKGIATLAASFFFRFGFQELKLEEMYSIIHPENISSQRVANKNGLIPFRRVTFYDCPAELFRIDANQWKMLNAAASNGNAE